jgi:hypothetical protein
MTGPLETFLISPQSVKKRGRYRQFFFLVDHCFFNFSSEATWPVQIVPMRYRAWPSYSIHLTERFHRRRLQCEKVMDGGRQTIDNRRWTTDAK